MYGVFADLRGLVLQPADNEAEKMPLMVQGQASGLHDRQPDLQNLAADVGVNIMDVVLYVENKFTVKSFLFVGYLILYFSWVGQ